MVSTTCFGRWWRYWPGDNPKYISTNVGPLSAAQATLYISTKLVPLAVGQSNIGATILRSSNTTCWDALKLGSLKLSGIVLHHWLLITYLYTFVYNNYRKTPNHNDCFTLIPHHASPNIIISTLHMLFPILLSSLLHGPRNWKKHLAHPKNRAHL